MADQLDDLLDEGRNVLKSRIPSRNPFLYDSVERTAYHRWVMNCISLLSERAPEHVAKIQAVHQPNLALHHQAEQIFGILESAVFIIRSKAPQPEAAINPQSFSLDFLDKRIVEKCRDHFYTGKYDDCILNAAKVVEVAVREAAGLDNTHLGVKLMRKALNPQEPLLRYSEDNSEQEAAMHMYAGFIGVFKNPHSHRFLEIKDPIRVYEVLSLANLLLSMIPTREQQ